MKKKRGLWNSYSPAYLLAFAAGVYLYSNLLLKHKQVRAAAANLHEMRTKTKLI